MTAPVERVSSWVGMHIPCLLTPTHLNHQAVGYSGKHMERRSSACTGAAFPAALPICRTGTPWSKQGGSEPGFPSPGSPRTSPSPAEQMVLLSAGRGGGNKAQSNGELQPGSGAQPWGWQVWGRADARGCLWRADPVQRRHLTPALSHFSFSFVVCFSFPAPFQLKRLVHRFQGCR